MAVIGTLCKTPSSCTSRSWHWAIGIPNSRESPRLPSRQGEKHCEFKGEGVA
ncbi:hypothetical protein AVEN_64777-1, partial [Araneus ventricosus]